MAGVAAMMQAAEARATGAGLDVRQGMVLQHVANPMANYELQDLLGSGGFGEVWRCVDRGGKGEQRAVKIVRTANAATVQAEVDKHRRAVQLAGSLHIPQLFEDGAAELLGDPPQAVFMIAMELIDGLPVDRLSLPEFEERRPGRRGSLDRELVARAIMHDVTIALSRLHVAGVVHRDVKPANVLVNRRGECYLCDFGVSMFLTVEAGEKDQAGELCYVAPDGERQDQVGTPLYMAPEILKYPCPPSMDQTYDAKVDVWSLGVMGYELDLGRTPLHESQGEVFVVPPQGAIFETLQTMVSPIFESRMSMEYRNMVQRCLEVVPESRPTSPELLRYYMPRMMGNTGGRILAKLVAEATGGVVPPDSSN